MSLFGQFFPQQPQQQQPMNTQAIDQQQFTRLAVTLDKDSLRKLVMQARQQGIPEQQIESGLNFILNLR